MGYGGTSCRIGWKARNITIAILVVAESGDDSTVKVFKHDIRSAPLAFDGLLGHGCRLGWSGVIERHGGGCRSGRHISLVPLLLHIGIVAIGPEIHEVSDVDVIFIIVRIII